MIGNAREFNEKGSRIYDDAERLRKVLSNFMTKHNPAYKIPGYVALPTPIPGEEDVEEEYAEGEVEEEAEEVEIEAETPVKRRGRPPKNSALTRKSATPALYEASKYSGTSFSGLTFQQAQEKIVADMVEYKEDPEFVASSVHPNGSLTMYSGMTSPGLNHSLNSQTVVSRIIMRLFLIPSPSLNCRREFEVSGDEVLLRAYLTLKAGLHSKTRLALSGRTHITTMKMAVTYFCWPKS